MSEDFSVCIIARNEARGMGRLLESLRGVGDIVVLDTGSTDDTVQIARRYGCNVVEVGERFKYYPTQAQVDEWRARYGWEPAFTADRGYFHFADARNHAATFAKHDFIFCPDGDEAVVWDLDKVREAIQGEDHLVYRFAYAHNPDGTPALEFTQCKFFRRSKFKWVGYVHEVEQPIPGANPKLPAYCQHIFHHHWQNNETGRGNYLPGLELAVLSGDLLDRNLFYLGREYMYRGEWDKAIELFNRSLEVQTWKDERGEAYHFIGNCYRNKGDHAKAVAAYHQAFVECDSRREPFFALASLYDDGGDPARAVVYYKAAMAIPYKEHGYLNSMSMYGALIPDRLAFAYYRLGDVAESKRWWLEAMKLNPDDRILNNFRLYCGYDTPLVSIVVPTVRPDGYRRLVDSIRRNTVYPNYEIVTMDGEGTAIEKFNRGVKQARGELVVFLADDTEVTRGWLIQAYTCFRMNFENKGLVILNEGYWDGQMANHFLCSKNLRDELGGEIWHGGYHHVGADNELYYRLRQKRLVAYCPEAKIIHHHPWTPTRGTPTVPMDEYHERISQWVVADRRLLYRRQRELGFGPQVAVFCTTNNNEAIIGEFVAENLKYVRAVYISDNGSTDRTVEVARSAGAHVRTSGLIHNAENYDEAQTKQAALDFALTSDCDWLLYLDSDEILEERATELLPELVNDLRFDSYGLAVPTFWMDRVHYRIDGDFALYVNHPYQMRLFRRAAGVRMTNPPNKGMHSFPAVGGDPARPYTIRHTDCELMIKHYSFPDRATALFKYERYRKADPQGVMSRSAPNYEHLHPDYPGVKLATFGQFYPVLDEIIRPGDLVFDIGANVGRWTRIFKDHGARVISVEPNPEVAGDIINDVIIRKAVTDHSGGVVTLYLPNSERADLFHSLSTIVRDRAFSPYYVNVFNRGRQLETEAITLDDLISQYGAPRHIKIDIEGADAQALRGLHTPVDYISFEISGMQPDWRECFEIVARLGDYRFNVTPGVDQGPDDWKFLTEWSDKDTILAWIQARTEPLTVWNVYCRREPPRISAPAPAQVRPAPYENGIDGFMLPEELGWLFQMAQGMNSILEIGSWKGRSTHALLSACKGTVTAVDTFLGTQDPRDWTYKLAQSQDIYAQFMQNVGRFPNLEVLRMTSEEAAQQLDGRRFDMIFIDADHFGVGKDIALWRDRADVLLCGHDYSDVWAATKRAVNEAIGQPDGVAETIWYKHMPAPKIPQRIFTIWLNQNDPALTDQVKAWIETHKLPGYEHRLITLDNCYTGSPYVQAALAAGKFSRASDWLRLHCLYTEGGIYLDADIEILAGKNFDGLLNRRMFAAREKSGWMCNAVLGAVKGHPFLKRWMDDMEARFRGDDPDMNKSIEASIEAPTKGFFEWGWPTGGFEFVPTQWLYPFDHMRGTTEITPETITYHHFLGTWTK